MRFLLIFLGVLLVAWRWRTWRTAVQRERKDIVPPSLRSPIWWYVANVAFTFRSMNQ